MIQQLTRLLSLQMAGLFITFMLYCRYKGGSK